VTAHAPSRRWQRRWDVLHLLLWIAPGLAIAAAGVGLATLAVDAVHTPLDMHHTSGEHGRAERVVAAVEVPGGTTWDPARIHDDGKAPGDTETPVRACRCEPRQPVVSAGAPSVTDGPLSRPSVPLTASDPLAGVPVTPRTSTTPPSATERVDTTAPSSATPTVTAPQTTTTAADSTTDDPDGTTAATTEEP
jgi:hypothetical protein